MGDNKQPSQAGKKPFFVWVFSAALLHGCAATTGWPAALLANSSKIQVEIKAQSCTRFDIQLFKGTNWIILSSARKLPASCDLSKHIIWVISSNASCCLCSLTWRIPENHVWVCRSEWGWTLPMILWRTLYLWIDSGKTIGRMMIWLSFAQAL